METELVTITAMYSGHAVWLAGAPPPGPVLQVPPTTGPSSPKAAANPLKLAGADPPLKVLACHHFGLHHVTVAPTWAS